MKSAKMQKSWWANSARLAGGAAAILAALAAGPAPAARDRLATTTSPVDQTQVISSLGAPNARCSDYTGWKQDGCRTATGAFLIASYFSAESFYDFASQSGQHWAKGSHPWNWNAPGVDYGVGPALLAGRADPATTALPEGCVYKPRSSPMGGPEIHCGAAARDPDFDGLDLGSNSCTPIVVDAHFAGQVTISNSRLRNGANCGGKAGAMIRVAGGTVAGVALINDFVDEDYPRSQAPLLAAGASGLTTAPFVMIYTVVLNGAPTPLAGNYVGPQDIENSVFIGSAIASTDARGARGELCELGCPAHPVVYPTVTYRNNVVVVPVSTHVVVSQPPPLKLDVARTDTTFTKDHNIFVINYARGAEQPETTAAAMVRLSYSSAYGSAIVTNNYVDSTGAYSCVQDFGSLIGPSVVKGNRSLTTDMPITGIGDKSTVGSCAAVY